MHFSPWLGGEAHKATAPARVVCAMAVSEWWASATGVWADAPTTPPIIKTDASFAAIFTPGYNSLHPLRLVLMAS